MLKVVKGVPVRAPQKPPGPAPTLSSKSAERGASLSCSPKQMGTLGGQRVQVLKEKEELPSGAAHSHILCKVSRVASILSPLPFSLEDQDFQPLPWPLAPGCPHLPWRTCRVLGGGLWSLTFFTNGKDGGRFVHLLKSST